MDFLRPKTRSALSIYHTKLVLSVITKPIALRSGAASQPILTVLKNLFMLWSSGTYTAQHQGNIRMALTRARATQIERLQRESEDAEAMYASTVLKKPVLIQ